MLQVDFLFKIFVIKWYYQISAYIYHEIKSYPLCSYHRKTKTMLLFERQWLLALKARTTNDYLRNVLLMLNSGTRKRRKVGVCALYLNYRHHARSVRYAHSLKLVLRQIIKTLHAYSELCVLVIFQ